MFMIGCFVFALRGARVVVYCYCVVAVPYCCNVTIRGLGGTGAGA